ncbi:MAG: hypothetical protein ABEH78_02535 [Haloferacaceae archaeon]
MAHLSDDRAQILLIGALAMAVAFVALALVLNSSVYVENLANRENVVVGGQGPTGHQGDVRRGVGKAVVAGNANGTSLSDREAEVEQGVATLRSALRAYHAERATVANVTLVDTDEGTHVFRSTDGNFTAPNDDDPHWQLTAKKNRFRYFSMNVSRSGLKDIGLNSPSEVFYLRVDDGTDVWTVYIYKNISVSPDETVVRVDPSGATCTDATGSRTDINITSARVAGEHCEALDFFESVDPPYTVEFRNAGAGNVSGQYDFTVEEPAPLSPDYAGDGGITTQEVVYDATAETVYYSPDARYVADVRAAPGEPDA